MKRGTLRRFSRVRGGLSRCQRDDLRELCREVVMTRAKAFLFEEGKKRSWQGECAICGKVRWLQVCHIFSQGKYPRAAFMPDNCFPGCWRCHLGPGGWHLEPTWAAAWIVNRLGACEYEKLKLKVETAGPVEYTTSRLWLLEQMK